MVKRIVRQRKALFQAKNLDIFGSNYADMLMQIISALQTQTFPVLITPLAAKFKNNAKFNFLMIVWTSRIHCLRNSLTSPSAELYYFNFISLSTFSSPGWAVSAVAAFPFMIDALVPSSSCGPPQLHVSYTDEPTAGLSTPGVASPILIRGEGSLLKQMAIHFPNVATNTVNSVCSKKVTCCCLIFSLVSTRVLRSILQSCFPAGCPHHVLVPGFVSP